MLKVSWEACPEYIIVSMLFDEYWETSWFEGELNERICKEVDETPHISGACFNSPVFDAIPPERLSGGATYLYLLNNYEPFKKNGTHVDGALMGDNCYALCKEIASDHEVIFHAIPDVKEAFKLLPYWSLEQNKMIENEKDAREDYIIGRSIADERGTAYMF